MAPAPSPGEVETAALAIPQGAVSPRVARYARQAASLWCAAAVGALAFSIRVATTVFRDLPGDRLQAGRIAGRAFVGAYAISVASALVALVVVWTVRTRGATVDRWLAASLLAIAATEFFWIAPAIQQHGVGWPGSFASLHATGGGLHVALMALALVLAWRLVNEADAVVEPQRLHDAVDTPPA